MYANYHQARYPLNATFYTPQQALALLAPSHHQTVPSQPVRRQPWPVTTAPSVPSQPRLAPMPAPVQPLQQAPQQQQPQQHHQHQHQQQHHHHQQQQQQGSPTQTTCETAGLQSQSQSQQIRASGFCSSCAIPVSNIRQADQRIVENVCEQCKHNWLQARRGVNNKGVVGHAAHAAHPVHTAHTVHTPPSSASQSPISSMSPLHFGEGKTPAITFEKEPPTPMIVCDVYFTEQLAKEEEEVQFDSDGTDDTELLTPGLCLSPPMSPRDIFAGDASFCDFMEEKLPMSVPSRPPKSMRNVTPVRPQADSVDIANTPRTARTSAAQSTIISPSSSATVTPDPSTPAEPDVLSAQAAPVTDKRSQAALARAINARLRGTLVANRNDNGEDEGYHRGEDAQDMTDVSSPECTLHFHTDSECGSSALPTPDLVSSKRKRPVLEENSDEEADSDRSSSSMYAPRKVHTAETPKRYSTQAGNKSAAKRGRKLVEPMQGSDSEQSPSDSDNDSEYRPSLAANRKAAARKKKSAAMVKRSAARSTRVGAKRRQPEGSSRKSREGSPAPVVVSEEDSQSEAQQQTQLEGQQEAHQNEMEGVELTDPRPTRKPTVFQQLTDAGIDWCRYCGTTEGVNWRPGPWGKRTLCNKHGCDYKGYGFACKLPRLDLTGFMNESVEERDRPVLQLYCTVCHKQESFVGNVLVRCEGCPRAYHQNCHAGGIDDETVSGPDAWHCENSCRDNLRRRRIVVELPRKKLPLMTTPKAQISNASTEVTTSTVNATGTTSRPRSSRRNSSSRS